MFSLRNISVTHDISKVHFSIRRLASQGCSISFIGRDFFDPLDFSCKELKTLLWTAADLKSIFKARKMEPMNLLANRNATLLINAPHIKMQVAVRNAVRLLGATSNVIVEKRWDTLGNVGDGGRCLSQMTDIIICKTDLHENMSRLRDGASVPVVNYATNTFKPLQGLADLMTLQEHYGRLKGLKLGWVGPPEGIFNTYLIMCPRMGMDIQYACYCTPDLPFTPTIYDVAAKNCILHNTEIAEYNSAEEATYRVDVLATTGHDKSNMQITKKMASDAAVNWTFLHDLPRTIAEVSDDVFCSPRNKAWESCGNLTWVSMAVILHLLRDYTPRMEMPNFDGNKDN